MNTSFAIFSTYEISQIPPQTLFCCDMLMYGDYKNDCHTQTNNIQKRNIIHGIDFPNEKLGTEFHYKITSFTSVDQ